MIVIVDYKTANLGSIVNMLKRAGAATRVAERPEQLEGASHLVLPGIGHFDTCARNLRTLGFAEALTEPVRHRGIPLLGICVGAQLLTHGSEEGTEPGLAWIAAFTRRIPDQPNDPHFKVPHMGWNLVQPVRQHALFEGMEREPRFYFVHSYAMHCDAPESVLATTTHGVEFASAVVNANIVGTQFHPEKSHRFGLQLMRNFANLPSPALS
jgi:imidazole glycerol-phosphate synthase subunit HisH